MKKIKKLAVINGITGQDGAYLAQYLLSKQYRVIGLTRNKTIEKLKNLIELKISSDVQLEAINTQNVHELEYIFKTYEPQEIYHLAGQSSVAKSFSDPSETYYSTIQPIINILNIIKKSKINTRIFNAGSSECYGNVNGITIPDEIGFNPQSPYATAKSVAHSILSDYRKNYNIYCCTGFLFNHDSPLRGENFVSTKIVRYVAELALKGEMNYKLHLNNLNVARDWGWAPEYVKAMWLMLQQERPVDYLICSGKTRSLLDFVDTAFKCINADWRQWVTLSGSVSPRVNDVVHSSANPVRIKEELGWSATVQFEEIISRLVEAHMKKIKC